MQTALLLVPDFLLIVIGWGVCRYSPLGRPVWDGAERLVYYLLFPALLFEAIVRHPLQPGTAWPMAACAAGITLTGIALALSLAAWPGVEARTHASGAQTAFRFNSYIALALAARVSGAEGLAGMALLIAVCVPLCNVAAVWPLARQGGQGYLRELSRNPLILATGAGLAFNLLQWRLPELAALTLSRMGAAALPLGLMAVGAGLALGGLRAAPGLAAALLALRHAVLPLVAISLALAFALPVEQRRIAVAFGALPTSAAAYVLAARLGGNASYVAGIVTLSTVLAMFTLPLWLALAPRL